MKKTNLFAGFFLFATILVAQEITQPTLVKEASTNPIDIAYEKWKLPNGLTVLIHEDHSDPIVQVHVTYHVGSNRESAGKSGFAHFFEHMLFQGSEHVEDERHFKIVKDAGGDMNGNTWYDRTVYYNTVPSNYLETALWLEADRMGFMLNAVTEEKFENQRDAVKNEKYQNQIDRPYGMTMEILGQTLYPPSHPYNWPVIGYVDDLDRANLQDLQNFYLRWYGPNNAYLTISGDVTSEEVMPLVEKYFGSINKGPEVRRLRPNVPRLSSDVYTGYTDNIYLPLTLMVFPTVPKYHKDEAALDILSALMGDGKSSLFYKNFVKNEKATDASASHQCFEISGAFYFQVVSFPDWTEDLGVYFNNIEADIRNTIAEWEEKGITDEQLAMVKAEIVASTVDAKTSVSGKSSIISEWEWLGRGRYNISSELDRYNKVTKADVMRVYNKYIKGKKAVICQVRPKNPFVKSKNDSLISINPNANLILKDDPQYDGLVYNRPVDNFDRSIQPKAQAPKTPKVPDYYKATFDNGMALIGTESHEVPKVYIRLNIKGGSLLEDPKKTGLASLTADLMNESTKLSSAEKISDDLKKLGSSVSFHSSGESTTVFIESLTENLDATLKIAEEKLFNPAFNSEDFNRIRKQTLEGIEASKKNAQGLAFQQFSKQLFGETAFGLSPTEKSIKKIKIKDIQAYYNNNYSPSVSSLVVVGAISKEELLPKLDFLKNWKAKKVNVPEPSDFSFNDIDQTEIFILDKEGASQSVIVMGHLADKYDVAGDHFKSQIMNYPLGGGASGRLFLNLREDKGYTYGVYSFFSASEYTGLFGVVSSIKTNATDSALTEIFKELEAYTTTGLTEEEVSSTKQSMLNSEALDYETPRKKLGFISKILKYDLDKSYIDEQASILNSVTKEDMDALAKAKINPNKMAIVIVGNKYLIKKKLEKFSYKIKEIKY